MHNERCMSGSEGGHQKPATAMSRGADARPYPIFGWRVGSSISWPSSTGSVGACSPIGCRITMEADFCIEALEEALAKHGAPEIFNTDQGSQFTSEAFTRVLIANNISISMDGKGAWRDNVFVERIWKSVKYEEVVCCERNRSHFERVRCFTGDEGRSLEVGLQEQASNRHELHWLRANVVNVAGKGGARLRQVRFKEMNESEPLMTCRNVLNGVETGTQTSVPRIKIERSLSIAQSASGMEAA